jgi:serine/threonine protein kinase
MVDQWSAGCVLGEIFRMGFQHPQLFPGQSEFHQLKLIVSAVGCPGLEQLRRDTKFAEVAMLNLEALRKKLQAAGDKEADLGRLCAKAPANALGLVRKLVAFLPQDRITSEVALTHPFFGELHCPEDEPRLEPLALHLFEFERRKMPLAGYREELFRETANGYRTESGDNEFLETFDVTQYRLLEAGENPWYDSLRTRSLSDRNPSGWEDLIDPAVSTQRLMSKEQEEEAAEKDNGEQARRKPTKQNQAQQKTETKPKTR